MMFSQHCKLKKGLLPGNVYICTSQTREVQFLVKSRVWNYSRKLSQLTILAYMLTKTTLGLLTLI